LRGKNKEINNKIKVEENYKKILKVILWISLFFLVVRGILLTINPVNTKDLRKYVDDKVNNLAKQQKNTLTASAFAENAIRYFFEYDGNNDGYKAKLQDYFSSAILTSVSRDTVTRVLDVKAVNQKIENSVIVVDCKVMTENDKSYRPVVQSTPSLKPSPSNNKKSTAPSPSPRAGQKNEQSEFYIRICVSVKDGKYLIENYPTFINDAVKSNENTIQEFEGDKIDNGSDLNEIQENTKSFLKAYCEGTKAELSFFFTKKDQVINTLEGKYIFLGMEKFELVKNSSKYTAVVTYKTDNSSLGYCYQSMKIVFVKNQEKYMVESIINF
jgi:hypothetical protein